MQVILEVSICNLLKDAALSGLQDYPENPRSKVVVIEGKTSSAKANISDLSCQIEPTAQDNQGGK